MCCGLSPFRCSCLLVHTGLVHDPVKVQEPVVAKRTWAASSVPGAEVTCALYHVCSLVQRLCLPDCPQLKQLTAGSEHCKYLSISFRPPALLSLACTFPDGAEAPNLPSKLHCHSSWPGPAERVTGAHRSWPADSWGVFKRMVVLMYKRTVR